METPDAVRERLRLWLAARLPGSEDVRIADLRIPGSGFSAETWFVDVDAAGARRKFVVRRQRDDSDLFLDADLALPFEMMRALERVSTVDAPTVLGLERDRSILDAPFLVMEAVPGRVVDLSPSYNLSGWVAELDPDQRRRLWLNAIEAIAALHRLDWRDGFRFLDRPERGAAGLDQYLDWVRDWYQWARADRPMPVADAALQRLFEMKPHGEEVCVLWGDPNPSNILFAPDLSVAGLLDFEMAALGPGEADLAWWLMVDDLFGPGMGIERLPGLPSVADMIAHYERARGRAVRDLDYFMLLARFRMNTVGIRTTDRLVGAGRMAADTDVLTHNPLTKLMALQLGLPAPEPGEGFASKVRAARKAD